MKFAHLSDSHIGFRQYGLERRRKDFEQAFESAVSDILNRGIRFIVHTGDLLNSNRPGPDAIQCLNRIHRNLIAHNAHMAVASGNHDYTIPPWPSVLVPDEYGIKCRDFEVVRSGDASFYFVPSMPVEQFMKHEFKEADVLLWHGLVRPFINFEAVNSLDISELPCHRYRMILLGDVHITEIMTAPQNPACKVGYIGSTEMCNSREPEEKFWGEIDTRDWSTRKHIIATRPILHWKIESEITDSWMERMIDVVRGLSLKDTRKPIIFIDYGSHIPGVVERMRRTFNPDEFILQFRPEMVMTSGPGVPMPAMEDNMSVEDLLRSKIAMREDLVPVALGLVNQDMDPKAVLDEFIEQRIRNAAGRTEPAYV
jgi:Calcineurin-like phosphoesterase